MLKHARIAPWLGGLLVAGLALSTAAGPAFASERIEPPRPGVIETLLRAALEDGTPGRRTSLLSFDSAELLDFGLLELERVSPARFDARVDLKLDFGPAPEGVLGYERMRRGLYELELRHNGANWTLQQLTPLATTRPMPG